jgi:hypothetical protein
MYSSRKRWFFTAMSLATAGAMMLASSAYADDGKDGKGGDHDRGRGPNTAQEANHQDRDDGHAAPAVVRVQHDNDEAAEHQNDEAVEHQNEEAAERANDADEANEANEANEVEEAAPAADAMATLSANLVSAFNNQSAVLGSLSSLTAGTDVDDENEDVDDIADNEAVARVDVVNLSSLTAGLTGANLTAVNNAATADAGPANTFFNANSPAALAIKAQLTAAGLNPASVLAIVAGRGDRVVVVMNA